MLDPVEIDQARKRSALAATPATEPATATAEASSAPTYTDSISEPNAVVQALARRRALRGAITRLKTRESGAEHVMAAILTADEDGVLTAILGLAVHEWLDREAGRDQTRLTELSAQREYELRDAAFRDPAAVASLPPDEPMLPYLRELAELAATPSAEMHNMAGQPARHRPGPVSLNRILVRRS